jgi:hypothetical protein
MKTYLDHCIVRKILQGESADFPNGCALTLSWPTLLECLSLGDLLADFPLFNLASSLKPEMSQESLFSLFDELFAEILTLVKNLPQIDRPVLLQRIQEVKIEQFRDPLKKYEALFLEQPYETMHDLILYLAWDRVCINLAHLFETAHPDLNPYLRVLKECLLESFIHITKTGKSTPSFFRLMETFYAFYMREENLQSYSETEWLILCQSSAALKPREELPDVFYIDQARQGSKGTIFTTQSAETVQATLSLYTLIVNREKENWPDLNDSLVSFDFIFIK